VIHAVETFNELSYSSARLAPRHRARLILTCWENIPFQRDGDPEITRRKLFVQSVTSVFLAASPAARDALVIEGVDPERIRILSPGIDASLVPSYVTRYDVDQVMEGA
jgi:alpha-maltose-1-phosphate synthase